MRTGKKMSLLEKSECFRAFLILIGRDRLVSHEERTILMKLGKKLDFEKSFIQTSLDDLLENRHISMTPPHFSSHEIAESFLRDAVMIAFADRTAHKDEWTWLSLIARENGFNEEWLERAREETGQWNPSGIGLAIEAFI